MCRHRDQSEAEDTDTHKCYKIHTTNARLNQFLGTLLKVTFGGSQGLFPIGLCEASKNPGRGS